MPLMCKSTAHLQPGKPETVHHAGIYQENIGSKASMGASSHRDQGWEEGKHVDHAGEEGICQPDSRVRYHGIHDIARTHGSNTLPAKEVTWIDC